MKIALTLLFIATVVAVGGLGYVGFTNPANSKSSTNESATTVPSRDTSAEETPSSVHTAKPVRVTATGSQVDSLKITMNGLLINTRDGSKGFSSRDSDTEFQFGSRLHYLYGDQANTLIARANDAQNVTIRVTQGDNVLCERSVSGAFESTCTFQHTPLYQLQNVTTASQSFSGSLSQKELVTQLEPDIGRNASFILSTQLGLQTALSSPKDEDTAMPTLSAVNRKLIIRDIENNSQVTPAVEGVSLPSGTTGEILFRVTADRPQRLAPLDNGGKVFGVAVLRRDNDLFYLASLDRNSVFGAL